MMTIFNLYRGYKPLQFFSLLALLLVLTAAAAFVPAVLIPYYHTGLVENFPTLIVCGFAGIASLIALFNGMVLDAIRSKERREFEFRLVAARYMQRYARTCDTIEGSETYDLSDKR